MTQTESVARTPSPPSHDDSGAHPEGGQRLSARALADALGGRPPTDEQVAIIEAPLDSMLVVAGAGSGKTETMASRVVWLVANGLVAPQQILGLTFTRKASIELATRLSEKLRALIDSGWWIPDDESPDGATPTPDLLLAPTVSTYHAYAARIVAEHGLRVGVEPAARVLSEAACWQIAHEVVHRYAGDMDLMDLAENTVVRAVLDLSGELSEHLVEPAEMERWLTERAGHVGALPGREGARATKAGITLADILLKKGLVLPLVAAYRAAKQERSAVDFGDQMAIAAALARDVPTVGRAERIRYRAVLLDEFQDTAEAQMVLLSSLFAPSGVSSGSGESAERVPVVAVGDPHQSIYGWRGASSTTLNRFPHRFSPDEARATPVLSLSTSWRNPHAVLTAANTIAAPLRSASPVPVATLGAAPGAPTGSVAINRSHTHLDEAAAVADWVRGHWYAEDGSWTGCSAAVLCRNRAQFEPVVAALRAEQLPIEVVGLGGLLNAPELVDLIALLTAVQDPSRGDQHVRLLAGPVCRLGAADMHALWSWARVLVADYPEEQATLGEAIDHLPAPGWASSQGHGLSSGAHDRLSALADVIAHLRSCVGLPLADLLIEAERGIGLDIEVAADPDVPQGWSRAHLDALIEVASSFAATADRPTLGGFLAWLEAAREHERALEDIEIPELAEVSVRSGAVQVLTVHAAKGLEWDVVAVPGMVEGVFPSVPGAARQVEADAPESEGSAQGWTYKPHTAKGWVSRIGSLPYPLRGDRDGLPTLELGALTSTHELTEALSAFSGQGVAHAGMEERRLAYVALTRARRHMFLSAPVWSTGKKPRVSARFFDELQIAADRGEVDLVCREWADMPSDVAPVNPLASVEDRALWPVAASPRRVAMTEWVSSRLLAQTYPSSHSPTPPTSTAEPTNDGAPVIEGRGARAELVAMLLAERAHRARERGAWRHESLPTHVSTLAVLELAGDRERYLLRRRRPMPMPASAEADVGTRFHAWVEQHYASPALVDLMDFAGSGQIVQDDLSTLQAHFLASEWAHRHPTDIEIDVSTTVAGHTVRGRIDAVFARPDGGFTVVDWKTGRLGSAAEQDRRSLQLALYRVAYTRLRQRDISDVDAAFFYASSGQTVRPELPDEAELEQILMPLLSS